MKLTHDIATTLVKARADAPFTQRDFNRSVELVTGETPSRHSIRGTFDRLLREQVIQVATPGRGREATTYSLVKVTGDGWIPADRIGEHPELHSTPIHVVKLLVVAEGYPEPVFGRYHHDPLNEWFVENSPSTRNVTHFQPLPKMPKP